MAQYGGYNNQSGYGSNDRYGQSGGYAQQGNPYGAPQAMNPYGAPSQNTYGQQDPYRTAEQGYGQNLQQGRQGDIPLQQMNGRKDEEMPSTTLSILDQIKNLRPIMDDLRNRQTTIEGLQKQSLNDPNASAETQVNKRLERENTAVMSKHRALVERLRVLKSRPDAKNEQNMSQIGLLERNIRQLIKSYQDLDERYSKELRNQIKRQYRIVRPEASEMEVDEASQSTSNNQVFSQALMEGERRGQAQSALQAVRGRHEAIEKIEGQIRELAALFNDMNVLVVQQEPVVTQINQQSEVVQENVNQANVQLDGAITKARAANRKKWYCLGIAILIIIIIVIIVVVVVEVLKNR
ncbi:Plasma membrane t-SNARE, secretory vesicle fusion [Ptychographa xylographoides]|nr:Plasma membrane t-SNARE, secretory vesicle fusion [Ptychographa xylographoides]